MTFNSRNGHVARPPATFAALMRGPSQLGAVGLAASANGRLLLTSWFVKNTRLHGTSFECPRGLRIDYPNAVQSTK